MGSLCKVVDTLLLGAFLAAFLMAPLICAQTVLPETSFPEALIHLKQCYSDDFQDYLMADKPHFFVALVWLELTFQWPLALLNIYGILASKSWFNNTCLIYGASVITSVSAVLGELIGSHKASEKLLQLYWVFMGAGVVAMLRGLVPQSSKTPIIGKRPAAGMGRKKRA
ncbi:hypothetical protein ERO13_A12G157100v2 [Gossypium hirsutum]|uniref:EXPERA domain-containing protein n=4 Tax=Gossypium TaxID=3633 RepID=A0A2P5Y865_GOSBA|nr:uncharacterized protein LOC107937858 [Gossypium hirsutum]KAB2053123.1 hypothetical protein ES319_A12G166300v1 [Gossypium barbadense]TYG90442.1 hypothetical protein ES288_A12G182400v1 [Gossypium darwinii]TYH96494.1 hypothetical protein ES332_A12G181300v1 [Gossypium tomentosum]KAB2053124.1 hypothetical protein ES319_A12G166300v1 [Gossypium barbadense]KAB2053125.1 hypothetical protein ES319_A12G166300v1 [Gossypium barbadense]